MPMQAESLDVLESASVPPAQARAIVRAIEIEIAGASDSLATKHDVLGLHQASEVLRAELRGEMTALSAQLRSEIAQLAAQLRAEMTQLGAELRSEMTQLGTELRSEMTQLGAELRAELRAEIAQLGAKVQTEMAQQGSDLRKEITSGTRQMYVALLGQTAVMLGFFYFFLANLR